jgi:DNA mismatch repair protein MutS2
VRKSRNGLEGLSPYSAHALALVEFGKVLELVAQHAVSTGGAETILQSHPSSDSHWIEIELLRVALLRKALARGEYWQVRSVPDVRPSLRRLEVSGAYLDGSELRDMAVVLSSSRVSARQLDSDNADAELRAALLPLTEFLLSEPAAERAIERAIAEDGTVLDNASGALKRIRRDLVSHKQSIVTMLERIAGSLLPHQRVSDGSVTVREGRYVIPVRREARGSVGGIVHDASATGATLFVEPPAAVEHSNRIRELEVDERREVERILRELTESLRPLLTGLVATLDSLFQLDSLFARANFAEQTGGAPFEMAGEGEGYVIRGYKHNDTQVKH